jgi:hypothetical protein
VTSTTARIATPERACARDACDCDIVAVSPRDARRVASRARVNLLDF